MTSAYILILAILVLGGLLAVVGDRIGTKVGKARLRLFKLRPKKTATVVAIFTGTLISGSTLGLLFALSETLRDGVFRLDTIQKELRIAEADLGILSSEKDQIDEELSQVRQEKLKVDRNFKQIQGRYSGLTKQAGRLRKEVKNLQQQRERLLKQIPALQAQVKERDDQIATQDRELATQGRQLNQQATQLQTLQERQQSLQAEIGTRDRTIQSLDGQIAQRDGQIAQRDEQLVRRENQIAQRDEQLAQREGQIAQRDEQLAQREGQITQRDEQIAAQDEILQQRETDLELLTQQLLLLQDEVSRQASVKDRLVRGELAIVQGEVLSLGAFRATNQQAAQDAIDTLLRAANQRALLAIRNAQDEAASEGIVVISQAQVEGLIRQIQDGQEYVVRIRSAGNYPPNETEPVRVFADFTPNVPVFSRGDVIAELSIEQPRLSEVELYNRLSTVLAAAQFRSQRVVLGEIIIGDGDVESFAAFFRELGQLNRAFDLIQAIAIDDTTTAGPLRLQLVVSYQGRTLLVY